MSVFSRLFGRRTAGAGKLSRAAGERVYIVDAARMVDPRQRNGSGQASPRDNFAVLRTLSRFANREAVEIQAVFSGRALREAAEGQTFKGVRAFYAGNEAEIQEKIIGLVRRQVSRRDVVLLTDNAGLEKAASNSGAVCMRLSTFRKGLDEREERDRGGHGDRGRENRARENQAGPVQNNGERAGEPPRPDEPEKKTEEQGKSKEGPTVLDLIDPV